MEKKAATTRNAEESGNYSECPEKTETTLGPTRKLKLLELLTAEGVRACGQQKVKRCVTLTMLIGSAVGVPSLTNRKEIALMAAVKRRLVAPRRLISSGSLASESPSLKGTKTQPNGTAIVS